MQKKILIIDDDSNFVSNLIPAKSADRLIFSIADSLQRAKLLLQIYQYDIILANIKVPGGNCLELKDDITTCLPDAQFLFMSNLDSDYKKAINSGEECYYKYEIGNSCGDFFEKLL